MKYPLQVVRVDGLPWSVMIADADGRGICNVLDQEWGHTFAQFVVRAANRYHKMRPWFRPYTRDDWVAQRDSARIIKSVRS